MTQTRDPKKYERIKLILSISETVLSIALLGWFIFSGASFRLVDWVEQTVPHTYARFFLFIGLIASCLLALSMIFGFISGYLLEHRYQLSNQTFAGWLKESLKGIAVGIVLSAPILFLLYYFLRKDPDTWWLWAGLVMFVFSVLLSRLAPQLIFPLFYKFEPLDNPEILARMERLAGQGHFNLQGIFRFNMSKDTVKANAALTGIGKSKRIILGDNLLDQFSVDEIESVFAHEVGHHAHRHLWWMMLIGTISSFLMFYLTHLIFRGLTPVLHYQNISDLAALPLLLLLLSILGIIISPISNMISRHYEKQADRYALQYSGSPKAFISAMEKLAEINLADKRPHPVVEFLFHSHPSLANRIQAAESFINEQAERNE